MEALNLCRVNLNLRKRGRTYYQAVKLTLNKNTMKLYTFTLQDQHGNEIAVKQDHAANLKDAKRKARIYQAQSKIDFHKIVIR